MLLSVVIIFFIISVDCATLANSGNTLESSAGETRLFEPELPLRGCKEEQELVESCNAAEECGVYTMMIGGIEREVYCEVSGKKKFILAQRRDDYGDPFDYFFRGWEEYKSGFGDPRKSFWIGNDALHNLTRTPRELHIVMKDFAGGKVTFIAQDVQISDEENGYNLTMTSVSPKKMGSSFYWNRMQKFSTKDADNSGNGCPQRKKGGWWYMAHHHCGYSNLNGMYLKGSYHFPTEDGVHYDAFRGKHYSLKSTVIKIRVDKAASFLESCADVEKSGVYTMPIGGISRKVYCEVMGRKKFTVFQRRGDFGDPASYFFRGWVDYKNGFGDPRKQFWLGNDALHFLTEKPRELYIYMEDFDGKNVTVIAYDVQISDEDNGYNISMSSAYPMPMGEGIMFQNGMKFSTKDRDQDTDIGDCANAYKGAWWYGACHWSNLNGLYLRGHHNSYANGINFQPFRGHHYSLKFTEMKFRVDNGK